MAWTCTHNLRVVLGPCAQYYPCEASEQKWTKNRKLKNMWCQNQIKMAELCPLRVGAKVASWPIFCWKLAIQLVETNQMVFKAKLYHIFLSFRFLTHGPKTTLKLWVHFQAISPTHSSKSCFQNWKAWTPLNTDLNLFILIKVVFLYCDFNILVFL